MDSLGEEVYDSKVLGEQPERYLVLEKGEFTPSNTVYQSLNEYQKYKIYNAKMMRVD